MSLEQEIETGRHNIVADGYDMSLGELASLYEKSELFINPNYQRFFRWDTSQKTRFIESLLLRIPVPPIFVFQRDDGVWELIDGLQRLSTVFQLMGILRVEDPELRKPLVLEGTKMLPTLADKLWESEGDATNSLTRSQQIEVKRTRIRVEILQKGSSASAKYELFQRLNTGGTALSPQEVRNCVMIMISPAFLDWVEDLSRTPSFRNTVTMTEYQQSKREEMEYALRFIAFLRVPYTNGLDVHEYLDNAAIAMASDDQLDKVAEKTRFTQTFDLINQSLGPDAFKRFDGTSFGGKFLASAFEVVATGVAKNLPALSKMQAGAATSFIGEHVKNMWNEERFKKNSGAGIRGTTRLANLLPWAESFFKP